MKSMSPLKQLLHEEGRKQSWLAERTGIDPATINRIVHGLQPSEAQAVAIATALGVKVAALWPSVEAAA
jgi:transcriptional regulator with XRE-family HTH domain